MDQAYPVSAAMGTVTSTIPEDTTIKDVFAASGAQMQVSFSAAPRSMDRNIVEIPNSQVVMLAKKDATIVDQGGNYYSMSVVTLATHLPYHYRASGYYGSNPGGEVNPPYLLNEPTSGNNDDDPNPEAFIYSGLSTSSASLGEHNGDFDSPNTYNGGGDNTDDYDEY